MRVGYSSATHKAKSKKHIEGLPELSDVFKTSVFSKNSKTLILK